MSEEGKDSHHHLLHHHHHHHHHGGDEEQGSPPPQPPPQYGTFQGVPSYPPQPVIGFPQPVPPPGAHGYQATGYVIAEGTPVARERRLPCCGIGIGWFFFIIGFFLAGIPWYIAAFILLCSRVDPREKPGYITCTIAAILASFALIFGLTRKDWD
ncbi:OLC1v1023372C1 [Oldenlandia corymbosa var. corymbosa]|uniref:OLC1v1023372C1 n=1 Tax=Oldenlandia corymbosa var. corymbosa TaxID=529605 RepID=A0AAV1C2A0_OLDCO|nr:OLC1v1023372C1 [Oldenlandia corymbosa var. corymbosa]